MHRLLSEKGTYSPDVVQHESTGTCCYSNVGSVVQYCVKRDTIKWCAFRHSINLLIKIKYEI